jgi:hypothetical protein
MLNPLRRLRQAPPVYRAELIAAAWEIFSVLLFISAVFPAAFSSPWPSVVFVTGLLVTVLSAPWLIARGRTGITIAAVLRIPWWLASVTPLLPEKDLRVLVASCGFGVMAFGLRRAVYRRILDRSGSTSPVRLRSHLRVQLA